MGEITTIYLDMDGCVCDFVGGIAAAIKQAVQEDLSTVTSASKRRAVRKYLKHYGKTHTVTEECLKDKAVRPLMYKLAAQEGFFAGLDPLQEHKLYLLLESYVSRNGWEMEFLSAPIGDYAASDKERWVREVLGSNRKVNVVPRVNKVDFCTGPHSILIDDHPDTIEMWKEAGGTGFLYVDGDDQNFELLEFLLQHL